MPLLSKEQRSNLIKATPKATPKVTQQKQPSRSSGLQGLVNKGVETGLKQAQTVSFSPTDTRSVLKPRTDLVVENINKEKNNNNTIAWDQAKQLYGDGVVDKIQKANAFLTGFSDTATLGTLPLIAEKTNIGNNLYAKTSSAQALQPNATLAGNILGYTLPGIQATKALNAVKPLNFLKPVAKDGVLQTAKKVATQGALEGLGLGLAEGTFQGLRDGKEFLPTLKDYTFTNTLLGGAVGGVLGAASKKLKNIKSVKNSSEDLKYSTPNNIEPNLTSTLEPNTSVLNAQKTQGNIKLPLAQNNAIKTQNMTNTNNVVANDINVATKQVTDTNVGNIQNMQSKLDFNAIKTFDDIPNDEQGLRQFISEAKSKIESGEYKYLDIDLQQFAQEAEKRLKALSKVYTNTIENSDIFTKAEKDILNSGFTNDAEYFRKSEKESIEKARQRLNNDYEGEFQKLQNKEAYTGEDVDALFGMVEKELQTARQTGDFTTVKNLVSNGLKKAGREGGRAIQAFDKYSRTAEGKVAQAQNVVDNFEEAVKKQNPSKGKKVDDEIKATKEKIKRAKQETSQAIEKSINTVLETSFPKMLKDKIVNSLNPKTPEEIGFIRTLIKDLYGEAKESIAMPAKSKLKNNSIETLTDAYKYREYKGEIRSKAKELLQEQFKDNPNALELLDQYFNKSFKPPHSQGLLTKVINERLDKKTLTEWVKDFYATGRASRENFVDAVIKETGLTGDNALSLKSVLDANIKTMTKNVKDSLLENIMQVKKQGIIKKATTKLTELTNVGLLENNKFANRISEKITPIVKQLLRENNINMRDVVNMTLKNRNEAKAVLLRDVFKNTNVDDKEIVKLLDIINKEFSLLTKQKQTQILESLTKERTSNTKTYVDKIVEKINQGVYDDEVELALRDKIKEKYGLPNLTNDDIKYITETMDEIQDLPTNSEKYIESVAKVEKLIREKVPATLAEKFSASGMINMLGNITSQLTNIGGNVLRAGEYVALNPLRRSIDRIIGGNRTVGKINFDELGKGIKQGLRGTKRDMLGGKDFSEIKSMTELFQSLANPINTSFNNMKSGKFEQGNRIAFDNKTMRIAQNLVSSALTYGDRPFEQAFYRDILTQLKTLNPNVKAEELEDVAKMVANEMTYKGDNFISDAALSIRNLPKIIQQRLGIKPEALTGFKKVAYQIPQILSQAELPFAKTPANIIKTALNYSPLGIVEGLSKLASNKANLTLAKKREIVDILTRGIAGTSLLMSGVALKNTGMLTGSKEDNMKAFNLQKQQGFQPNALKLGNTVIDLKKFEPLTTPIIAGSNLASNPTEAGKSYFEGIGAVINNYADMSLLQNVQKTFELFNPTSNKDKTKILIDKALNIPKQNIPSMLKKTKFIADPFERNTKGNNLGEYAVNQIANQLPFVSSKLPPKVDYKGDPIKNYGGKNSFFNVMFNPYKITKISDDKILNTSLDLYKTTGDAGVLLPDASKTKKLFNKQLTIEEQNKYQKYLGKYLVQNLKPLLSIKDKNEKAESFKSAINDAKENAKEDMRIYLKK